ncbi:hypothetical protein QTO34_002027 [Cnephaeus nilssonii]|uniref:Protein CBFA2T2 n=1 Tax=Cnephaeus nilssonii TaxID=3371016 RepID=A0AA40HUV7_CNENI|nr:hypothetical protein QTO34_002027 [Eptesicus nilssonii]
MGKRNISQRKENVESPRKEISETEACNMTEKEFRVMVVEFIQRMDEKINNLCRNQEEMKSDIATIKNTMESFNSRLQEAEDRISELEDQVQKQAQAEQQLEKKIKKQEESLRELRDNMKRSNMRIIGLPEGQEEQQGLENLLEEIMTENFPDMGKIKVTQRLNKVIYFSFQNSTVTIEEFHCKLQEATNFPLRPFVIPFLKANLPLLQRELLHCARAAKQTPSQYLAQHEHLLLNTSIASPADSSELLMEVHGNGKRPSPERREDNGFERDTIPPEPPAKRVCTISPAPRHSPALTVPLMNPGGQFHPTPPPLQHYTLEDIATSHLYREPNKMLEHREFVIDTTILVSLNGGYQDELVDHRLTEREWAEEWKHLDHALNCIMEMVEKTRRSMAVLRRCQESDRDELNYWKRRYNENTEMRKTGNELVSRQHSPGSADSLSSDPQREFNSRPATGYVPVEFWKKTEEAVNKVKIQAMSEVQKAVAEAEQKAFEVIATERARMEQTIADVKRQAAEDAFLVINEQEESTENCWNCGRKASETCSGCNIARYCGSFCQHKDWERHHRLCGQNLHGQSPHSQSRPLLPGGRSARSADCSVPSPALDKTSATTSRSSTPASVTAIDSNGL